MATPVGEEDQHDSLSIPHQTRKAARGGMADLTTSAKNLILTEAGRSPWYSKEGLPRSAYVIGVAGGSASGKTSVARRILASLPNVPWVAIVSQDSFYRPLTPQQSELAFKNEWDFDSPRAFDEDLFRQCIADLKASKAVEIPVYSFVHHQRLQETTYVYGPSVIIVEGLFVLNDPEVRDLLDLKVYVQADSDLMLARRIMRDSKERGRDIDGVIEHYLKWVKPAVDSHIAPTAKWADLIVPGQNNDVAVDLVSQHVKRQLNARNHRLRSELGLTPLPAEAAEEISSTSQMVKKRSQAPQICGSSANISVASSSFDKTAAVTTVSLTNNHSPIPLPASVRLLRASPHLVGLLTILHDSSTSPEDFIFCTNRICSLVVEEALSLLPYKDREVVCNGTGRKWMGKELDVENICSIAILRSGSVFEQATRQAIPDLAQGSMLIQSSELDGEPQLYSLQLPLSIRRRSRATSCHVLLLDAQVATGAAAFMSIRVLLDHGVQEERILFLSVVASARGGLWALTKAFPKVRIILAGVDPGLKKLRIGHPPRSRERRPLLQTKSRHPRASSSRRAIDSIEQQGQEDPSRRNSSPPVQSLLSLSKSKGGHEGDNRNRRHWSPQAGNLPPDNDDEDDDDEDPRSSTSRRSRRAKFKTIWAITPGTGSIGDRYFRTD